MDCQLTRLVVKILIAILFIIILYTIKNVYKAISKSENTKTLSNNSNIDLKSKS